MAALNARVIETHGLTKTYAGGVRALDGLDLVVEPGQLFGFLGPNGAGKTTTVQLLIGAIRPTAGSGRVLGGELGDPEARRRLGYLPEQFQFPGFLTPLGLLDFHGRLAGMPAADRRERSAELLRLVGLDTVAQRSLKTFSKGMLQRVGLAQALIARPALLLLDEPTSGLDPIGTRNVRNLLLSLKDQGVAVLLNSHLLSEVELVCDRVAILARGRVAAEGRIDEILAPVSSVRIRARELSDTAVSSVRAIAREFVHEEGDWWRATLEQPTDVPRIAKRLVESGVLLEALVPTHETLEEAFMRLLGYRPTAEGQPATGNGATSAWGTQTPPGTVPPGWGANARRAR